MKNFIAPFHFIMIFKTTLKTVTEKQKIYIFIYICVLCCAKKLDASQWFENIL